MISKGFLGFLAVCASTRLFVHAQTTVTVEAEASHPIPTTLWGFMYEDISQSGDGGLYAELLQNRAFQQVTPGTTDALNAWEAVNGAQIAVVSDPNPVSNALPNSLQVQIPSGSSGAVGVANTGYFGINVDSSSTYSASFFYRFPTSSSFEGNAVVSLQTSNGDALGSVEVPISGSQTDFTQVTAKITPTSSASGTDNRFVVTVDGAAGETVNFAMFSLFPPTFKDRANGMRVDLAEALAEMGPAFWRFPGGNNLEGQTVDTRWQWNNTVGSLTERPGRLGDWGYINTDGLGILEYLEWCEDLDMVPIMAVWAGFALGGTSVAEDDLGPYIQQAIDQINFVIGDPAESDAAALRASLGRTEPFALEHVEIGNEDFVASNTYTYRWTNFVNALKAEFPQLRFLATTNVNSPVLDPKPEEYDVHVYQTPSWFADNSFMYDDFERDGTLYFEGEYAAISTNPNDIFGSPDDGRLVFPTMESSSGEAAFMIGLERNSDIVFAAAYAPLLNHIDGTQWTPNLITFDSGSLVRSTSFHTQTLFGQNRGDEYLPSTLPTRGGTLYWGVVRKTSVTPNEIIIKIANTAGTTETLNFELPFAVSSTGSAQVLTGAQTASNTLDDPDAVTPQTSSITAGQNFSYDAPGFSVNVLTLTVA
ncbi:arabinofuranosidase [Dendrothele bispora CBS 962.96]|uniref:non-reducing end alpha-L-arabinofuranosidase n=1 Tax=Dendrothele bispora (strain CBS 962.96) TaxID=1314807 RepID=A0A4S8LR47_DENBC|nr:arabinofuranosidase [Dendrothele bispora CBS 962.96]